MKKKTLIIVKDHIYPQSKQINKNKAVLHNIQKKIIIIHTHGEKDSKT